ncbi:MAG: MarR family transcriptional regulator [Actinomycetales bacterium]|nr:MAG: MarR family transcriptional regulator [Actinomycetales bacterium]
MVARAAFRRKSGILATWASRTTRWRSSVVEFTVLDALSRQDGWHMRMQQLARAAALSSSATTRLVNRLEDRGLLTRVLCKDDRRGIYTELTPAGRELFEQATPTHDAALQRALEAAESTPELAPLVGALHALPAVL